MRPGLSRIRRLLDLLDHPEQGFRSVLVAGSNGKGTTCAVLASCLQSLGWKTGLFTSPHLVSVRERFRVDGRCASVAAMRQFLVLHGAACHRLEATYFETTTAFALWWFRRKGVEWAVLEIGLGGRLDACNAVDPALSIVTSISLEHTEWLGSTEADIAREKGGVARTGRVTLSGRLTRAAERSLRATVRACGGHLVCAGRQIKTDDLIPSGSGHSFRMHYLGERLALCTGLRGSHAVVNASLAVAAAMHACRDSCGGRLPRGWKRALQRGVCKARWPARLEVISGRPTAVFDVAHNEAAMQALVADWRRLWPKRQPVILVGLLRDKPARAIGALLARLSSRMVITRPDSPRALAPRQLADTWRDEVQSMQLEPTLPKAWDAAVKLAGKRGCVLVTGSHFVVGPILTHLRRSPCGPGKRSKK
jgi:dihydrofolate synthase/folylpolyglutamate synthase